MHTPQFKVLYLTFLLYIWPLCMSQAGRCPVHYKPAPYVSNSDEQSITPPENISECVPITSLDPLLALAWLTTEGLTYDVSYPPSVYYGSNTCHIWSIRKQRIPSQCDRNDFAFEQNWVTAGCKVTLTYSFYTSKCRRQISRAVSTLAFTFLTKLSHAPPNISLLRIHDNSEGSTPAVLSELHGLSESPLRGVPLISLGLGVNPTALHDVGIGDVSAHAWKLWSAYHVLKSEGFVVSKVISFLGSDTRDMPLQFADVLGSIGLHSNISKYEILLCFKDLPSDSASLFDTIHANGVHKEAQEVRVLPAVKPAYREPISHLQRPEHTQKRFFKNASALDRLLFPDFISLPPYCALPRGSVTLANEMSRWVQSKLMWRCHHKVTSSSCYKVHYVDPFTPCLLSLQAALAEDYAWTRGWCSAREASARVPVLPGVEVKGPQQEVLQRTKTVDRKDSIRLGFLLTVYRDAGAVMRLLGRLYSPDHVYLLNIDSSSTVLINELRKRVQELGSNIFIASGTPVVYMASSASKILAQGMQWFAQNVAQFDYLIACTGSDYPLLPLVMMEKLLNLRASDPFPSVMNWNHATWQDAMLLQGMSAEGELAREAALRERRPPHAPMESRGTSQFGIPLTCGGQKSYVRLQARANMDSSLDSQWLFGKSTRKGKVGNVNAFEDQRHSSLPPDGIFRVWYKSDPATTAVFDRRSIEYILSSEEGVKHYHFFKSMLLGSEEHYIISLLANWRKTRRHVNQFSSMAVWNTWSRGSLHPMLLRNRTKHDRSPHTSFLTLSELPLLRGMSRNGVFFARKFSGKNDRILDMIDESILFNSSFPAGEIVLLRRKKKAKSKSIKKSKFSAQDLSARRETRSVLARR